jgi:hypothetical protein
MSRIKISVTQKNINSGTRDECTTCPVALAIITRTGRNVLVASDCVDFSPDNYYSGKMIPLPRSARRFINRFDQAKPVEPFNFFLEVTS